MAANKQQERSLDYLKSICIIAMILTHAAIWCLSFQDFKIISQSRLLSYVKLMPLLGLLPMMLPILAGISLSKLFNSSKKTPLIYGLSLIIIGFVFHFLIWGHQVRLEWDVLQFIGLSLLVLAPLPRRYFKLSLFILLLSLLSVWPVLKGFSHTDDSFIKQIFLGSLKEGPVYWPLIAWLPLVCYGILFSEVASKEISQLGCIIASLALFTLSYASYIKIDELFQFGDSALWGPSFFRPELYTQITLMLSFSALYYFVSAITCKFELPNYLEEFSHRLSVAILWVYLGHQFFGIIILENILNKLDYSPEIKFLALFSSLMLISKYIADFYHIISNYRISIHLKKAKQ